MILILSELQLYIIQRIKLFSSQINHRTFFLIKMIRDNLKMLQSMTLRVNSEMTILRQVILCPGIKRTEVKMKLTKRISTYGYMRGKCIAIRSVSHGMPL